MFNRGLQNIYSTLFPMYLSFYVALTLFNFDTFVFLSTEQSNRWKYYSSIMCHDLEKNLNLIFLIDNLKHHSVCIVLNVRVHRYLITLVNVLFLDCYY